jgi:hypothetical protein
MELPSVLERGERARLFPVLADTSKEGRTLSIFLSCLENVEEFGAAMLSSIGHRVGARSRIETYTEVVLKKGGEKKFRPDGLIVVRNGSKQWMALVEAKVSNSDLTPEQIESYLELAKLNGIETVLTLSNQFAPLPTHHPVPLPAAARKKAELFHWSWMFVVTQATLLLNNDQVADSDQRVILNEMVRFLTHPSAGVKSFDQMPASWTDLVGKVQAGGKISLNSPEAKEVVGAWHQEVRDLSLILSRQLSTQVSTRISRAHATDPTARLKAGIAELSDSQHLNSTLLVPAAAAPIEVCADLQKRSVTISMKLRAPDDRKGTKARLTWLLRQIQRAQNSGIHVRFFWPGRGHATQFSLAELRENPDLPGLERPSQVVLSFEILLVKDLMGRFAQRRNFISELEAAVPEFYEQVGQYLKAWQPSAPRIREERSAPEAVMPEALSEDAETAAGDM